MSNLQLRTISGVVLAVVVLALTWVGGLPFRLMAVAIAAAVFYEWAAMTRRPGDAVHQALAAVLLAGLLAMLLFGAPAWILLAGLGAALLITAAHAAVAGHTAWTAAGLAYAALSGISLALLRGDDAEGFAAILVLFAVVWATDILAYFVGRAVGGPKLAPAISPGKTWSGAAGGTAAGVLAGLAVALAAGASGIPLLLCIMLLLSVLSQAGDLFESWVKRRAGVKDSGRLIPGHGGVMDRVDGLVAAALALYLIGSAISGLDAPAQGLFSDSGPEAAATDSPAFAAQSPAVQPRGIPL